MTSLLSWAHSSWDFMSCFLFSFVSLWKTVSSVLCVLQVFTLATCIHPSFGWGNSVSVKEWRLTVLFPCAFALSASEMLMECRYLCPNCVLCFAPPPPTSSSSMSRSPLVFPYLPQVSPPLWLVLLAERLLTVWLSFWLLWCLFAILAAPGPPP